METINIFELTSEQIKKQKEMGVNKANEFLAKRTKEYDKLHKEYKHKTRKIFKVWLTIMIVLMIVTFIMGLIFFIIYVSIRTTSPLQWTGAALYVCLVLGVQWILLFILFIALYKGYGGQIRRLALFDLRLIEIDQNNTDCRKRRYSKHFFKTARKIINKY